jgi:hypothetical protein
MTAAGSVHHDLKLGAELIGKYVVFRYTAELVNAHPIRVAALKSNGMIELEGWAGEFAPHLYVVVEKV